MKKTEKETFDRLRRISFNEILHRTANSKEAVEFTLKGTGWTIEEYVKACDKYVEEANAANKWLWK